MIQVKQQFVPKEPFTLLISSGIDSVCAAHWLKFQYRKDFALLHFNHQVQTVNYDMGNAVLNFAYDFDFGVNIISRKMTQPAFLDTSENGLRQWRHHELAKLSGNFVTAHHLNDAVENYLMNCLQGTAEHKPISWFTQFSGFSIYHPFLLTTKQDFIDYAHANDLMKYVVEDPTNHDLSNNRSWMRQKLIPVLDERELGLEKIVKKKFYM